MSMSRFLNKLKSTRDLSDHPQHRLSAVVLYKNRPLAFGFNSYKKTHPMVRKYDKHKTLHAEVAALLKVKNKDLLPYCTMIVYRETKDGRAACSKPCETCRQILKAHGLKDVLYSTAEGWTKL